MTREEKQALKKKRQLHKDLYVLTQFVDFACLSLHREQEDYLPRTLSLAEGDKCFLPLCQSCADLLAYAIKRRLSCPLDPKPSCKHCPVHCYQSEYREKIRFVMRYSGMRLLLRGRLDLVWHYFF